MYVCVVTLTALVEPVDSDDVILAHLSRCTQRSIIIRNGNHSGAAILGESISDRASDRCNYMTVLHTEKPHLLIQDSLTSRTASQSCSHREFPGLGC